MTLREGGDGGELIRNGNKEEGMGKRERVCGGRDKERTRKHLNPKTIRLFERERENMAKETCRRRESR